jgi:hypothetical protein
VNACYNGILPDGGTYDAGNSDPCTMQCLANDAGVTSNTLYTTQDNCQNNGIPATVCNGTAPDTACMCN